MIKIKYDGAFPNLCSGHLEVWIDDVYYDFGEHCLNSPGNVSCDPYDDYEQKVEWYIEEYPKDFPSKYKKPLLKKLNKKLGDTCCGGCI